MSEGANPPHSTWCGPRRILPGPRVSTGWAGFAGSGATGIVGGGIPRVLCGRPCRRPAMRPAVATRSADPGQIGSPESKGGGGRRSATEATVSSAEGNCQGGKTWRKDEWSGTHHEGSSGQKPGAWPNRARPRIVPQAAAPCAMKCSGQKGIAVGSGAGYPLRTPSAGVVQW